MRWILSFLTSGSHRRGPCTWQGMGFRLIPASGGELLAQRPFDNRWNPRCDHARGYDSAYNGSSGNHLVVAYLRARQDAAVGTDENSIANRDRCRLVVIEACLGVSEWLKNVIMVDDGTALTDPHSVADLYAIGRCEENSAVAEHIGPDLQGSEHDERKIAACLESRRRASRLDR